MPMEPPDDTEEAGASTNMMDEPSSDIWERLDLPPPESLLMSIDLVNYTELDLPAPELKAFEKHLNEVVSYSLLWREL